jgi:hypothetical protein
MEGRSILPLLHGNPHERVRAAREETHTPHRGGWRDASSDRYVEQALYDLEADPHDLVNLAGIEAFRAVADDLRRLLIARMVAAGEAEPVIEAAPAPPAVQRTSSIGQTGNFRTFHAPIA